MGQQQPHIPIDRKVKGNCEEKESEEHLEKKSQ
jgi:hypothetical protein